MGREFPVFPGDVEFRSRTVRTIERDGYEVRELTLSEHTGTHLDAPAHFIQGGATAEQLPVTRLIAPLVVVSIEERARTDHDAELRLDDLHAWERAYGRIPPGAVVAMHSGWEARLPDGALYLNADQSGVLHSPGFSAAAAQFLVVERSVSAIGTDTISLDLGASNSFPAHRAALGSGCYGLENIARLSSVPPSGATLIVGGPSHAGATGGPVRLLAIC